jgi:Kef-type K+ transport system membrane component KefB
MEATQSFLPMLVVLLIAFAVPIVLSRFKRFSIPIVVGEIVAGMIVGRSGLSLIPWDDLLIGIFANFGIVFLMFLSGMEIDFNSLRGFSPAGEEKRRQTSVVSLAILHFVLTVCLASVASYLLVLFGLANNQWLVALILSTTSLGVVVPVLKESNLIGERFGQCILVSAVIADFATMLLITLSVAILSHGLTAEVLLITLLFVAFFVIYSFGTIFNKANGLRRTIQELSHATAQIKVRAAFAIMLGFVALSQTLGSEIILGAFLAGAIIGLLRTAEDADLSHQLEAIGFGFFIPIFFVKVGLGFNLPALLASSGALLLVPFLFVGAVLVKMIPALIFTVNFSFRESLAAGALLSARLSLIIAASAIGLRLGVIGDSVNSAIILVAIGTVIAAPLVFLRITPGGQRAQRRRIVVVGANDLGIHVARRLQAHLESVSIVDSDSERAAQAAGRSFETLSCNPERADAAMAALCGSARALVCTYDDPQLSYQVCDLAKNRYGVPHVVAQLNDASERSRFEAIGVTTLNAALDRPSLLALLARTPAIYTLFARTDDDKEVCEVTLTHERDIDKPLHQLGMPAGLLALAIRRNGELLVPHGNTRLCLEDRLTLVGSLEDIEAAKRRFGES